MGRRDGPAQEAPPLPDPLGPDEEPSALELGDPDEGRHGQDPRLEEGGEPWEWQELRRLALEVRRSRRRLHSYTPDFSYDDDRGVHHVEDTKGRQSDRYKLNRVLMEVCFETEVEEPR
jgi:hypothetical protein